MTQLLTDNEISTVVQNIDCGEVRPFDIEFARAIEAAELLEGKPAHLSEANEIAYISGDWVRVPSEDKVIEI